MQNSVWCVVGISIALTACSGMAIQKYDEEKELYQKTQQDTMNMSEYDKQRYYSQHNMGLIEPYNGNRPRNLHLVNP